MDRIQKEKLERREEMKEGRTENRRWRKKRWEGSERKGKVRRCGEVGGAREDERKRR